MGDVVYCWPVFKLISEGYLFMKYVVTGCAGFIGSHLCARLVELGHSVIGLDSLCAGSLDNMGLFLDKPNFEFVTGDIRDLDQCRRLCDGADYVLHQAALGSVPRSVAEPLLYHDVNSTGTLTMMVAARDAGVKRFVYASSSSVYGDTPTLPKIETMLPMPQSPYALTKLACEYYGRLFFQTYGLSTVGLRYFNVFGPRQNPYSQYAAVIPKFVTALLRGESPVVYGDGGQTRDFTYIESVIFANLLACTAPESACGLAYNIGGGERISLLDLAACLQDILGTNLPLVFEPERAGDVRDSLASITLVQANLGYASQMGFREGLLQTVNWYKEAC
jgi:UDP-N-acetylglucosamine/UDP-N-acetylgalactosamine 4-epimerase